MLSESMFSVTKIKTISIKEKKISDVEENDDVKRPMFTIPSQEMLKKQISMLKNVNV